METGNVSKSGSYRLYIPNMHYMHYTHVHVHLSQPMYIMYNYTFSGMAFTPIGVAAESE